MHFLRGRTRDPRWERSVFDLRPRRNDGRSDDAVSVSIPPEVAATLRTLLLLDTDTQRFVFRATVLEEGVVVAGGEEEFDELLDAVAAEANHEHDRRRARLDHAIATLSGASRTRSSGRPGHLRGRL